ncbi:MAG: hypothetical protein JKY15_04240 [Deltaproteobacteria bacterium]|nr:hypothetical protein [Deltaproteobacteria bacterium]
MTSDQKVLAIAGGGAAAGSSATIAQAERRSDIIRAIHIVLEDEIMARNRQAKPNSSELVQDLTKLRDYLGCHWEDETVRFESAAARKELLGQMLKLNDNLVKNRASIENSDEITSHDLEYFKRFIQAVSAAEGSAAIGYRLRALASRFPEADQIRAVCVGLAATADKIINVKK